MKLKYPQKEPGTHHVRFNGTLPPAVFRRLIALGGGNANDAPAKRKGALMRGIRWALMWAEHAKVEPMTVRPTRADKSDDSVLLENYEAKK